MSIFRTLFERKQQRKSAAFALGQVAEIATEFAADHPDILIILADPGTDVVFASYQGIAAPARLLNTDGSRNWVVADALKHKKGNAGANKFLQIVDGALYAIANTLYTKSRQKFSGKVAAFVTGAEPPPQESVVKLTDGSVLSMVQPVDQ